MRDLKFRAWDIDDKQFIYVHIGQDDVWLDDGIGSIEMPLHHSDFEQYTGLKDKNGREIYEGDVVKIASSYGYGFLPKGAKAKIEFDEKELCYKLRGQGEFRLTAKKELEIIGNIHENKELLKGEE